MNEDNIKSMFKTYSCCKISPHQIRHWYSTTFSKKYGVNFVQQQLGHRSANYDMSARFNDYVDLYEQIVDNRKA